MTDDDVPPEAALQVAQRALAKVNDVEGDVEELRQRLVAAELRLSEIDDDRDYESLSMDDKVGMVREHAFEMATDGAGRAALDYKDVRYGPFDGEPSPDTCYRLMRRAAGVNDDGDTVQDVPGFTVDEDSRPMKLKVNAQKAKSSAAFLDPKKSALEGGVQG